MKLRVPIAVLLNSKIILLTCDSMVFTDRDEFHFGRDDSLARIVQLRDWMRFRAKRCSARGRPVSIECRVLDVERWAFSVRIRSMRVRKPAIIDRLNFAPFVFLDIAAAAYPFCAQRRKSLRDIAMKIGIAPWPAGVVNAHRVVRPNIAVHRFCWGQSDFAERHTNVGMNFARDVNLFRIRELTVMLVHTEI